MFYEEIVFLQSSEDSKEAEIALEFGGEKGLFEHLLQWDMGDNDPTPVNNPFGFRDKVVAFGCYVVVYNKACGYYGLYKKQ